MYSGFVFLCNKSSLGQCVQNRQIACSDKYQNQPKTVKRGSIIFLFDPDVKTLVGPFTAVTEGATQIEPGTWSTGVNTHAMSENITVHWENLHIIHDADKQFPYLSNLESCELSTLKVQELMDALGSAPHYKG